LSPTQSPFPPPLAPAPVCTFGGEEFIWRFFNSNLQETLRFFFTFRNPNGNGFFPGDLPFYDDCRFFICFSEVFEVGPNEVFEFKTAFPQIDVQFPCEQDTSINCFETVIAPDNLPECVCEHFEFFADDFEEYPGTEKTADPLFLSRWEVNDGTVDVKGLVTDEFGVPVPNANNPSGFEQVSDFFFNPCFGNRCIDIDGTVDRRFSENNELNELVIRDVELPPSDAFFNRICTLNFKVRGNGRCGKNHTDIRNSNQAIAAGCLQFYQAEPVPLVDDLTVAITEDGAELVSVTFEDIPFDADFFDAGLTADVSNFATNVAGSFTVEIGLVLEEGGNIGPLLDDVDLTCCCPEFDDAFIGRVVFVEQGLTKIGEPVPIFRSDFRSLVGAEPSYEFKNVFSLGLGGVIIVEFNLGATGQILIFEETHCFSCFTDVDNAKVEVSVDGQEDNFVTVADSLIDIAFEIVPGGDNSIRKWTIDLPNGACFKFVKITDITDETSEGDNCDGFDLVAVQVTEPCCPTIGEPFITPAPTSAEDSAAAFGFGGTFNAASSALTVLAVVALLALAGLVVLTVFQSMESVPSIDDELKLDNAELGSQEMLPVKDPQNMTDSEAEKAL
jgi:hypothetical protein